jgi:hypothetical protein
MMTILGCPEKRQKTHAQVMEPSVAHQCQKQKKDTRHREMTLCLCCTMMELALTLKIWQNWYEMRVNGHHSASTSAGTSHNIREGKSPDDKKNSAFSTKFFANFHYFCVLFPSSRRNSTKPSICPCATTLQKNSVESSSIFYGNLMLCINWFY